MLCTVTYSDRQLDFIESYVDPSILPVFHHDVVRGDTWFVDITAPFCAWQILTDEISARMQVRKGRPAHHHTNQLKGMLARAAKPMTAVLMHPALSGRGKVGEHYRDGCFAVWAQPIDRFGRVWSPTPTGGPFELLKPRSVKEPIIGEITLWDHLGFRGADHWTYDPAVHEAITSRGCLPELRPVLR